jgi:hypothetical protein
MKKTIIHQLLFASFTIFTLMSCSKESLPAPAQENVESVSANKIAPADLQNTGIVTGYINPSKNSATIMLFGDLRTYGPYYSEYGTGQFRISGIAPGAYKLAILNPSAGDENDLQSAITMEVIVNGNYVTDVGVINL